MCECYGRPFPAMVTATATAAESGRLFPAVASGVAAPAAETAKPLCRLCREGNCAFDRARSYGLHNDALHHAILLLKYEEVTRLGDWLRSGSLKLCRGKARRSTRT
jgi:predicted amidophosphoribosyltransferase